MVVGDNIRYESCIRRDGEEIYDVDRIEMGMIDMMCMIYGMWTGSTQRYMNDADCAVYLCATHRNDSKQ